MPATVWSWSRLGAPLKERGWPLRTAGVGGGRGAYSQGAQGKGRARVGTGSAGRHWAPLAAVPEHFLFGGWGSWGNAAEATGPQKACRDLNPSRRCLLPRVSCRPQLQGQSPNILQLLCRSPRGVGEAGWLRAMRWVGPQESRKLQA